MCGSLLSKFKKTSNRVYPAIVIFPDRKRVPSETKFAHQDSACFEDRGFWKDGDCNAGSNSQFLASFSSESSGLSESEFSSQNEIEAAVRILDGPVLPTSSNNRKVRLSVMESYINEERVLIESAREILAFQGYAASSSYNTVAAQPLSSTNSTVPGKVKTSVAFNIPACNDQTICASARVPRRLRKRGKVAPELTLQEVREKMRAAEERKLKELERIRECARSRAGMCRPHPAEVSAQATKEKIAAKQAAAEMRRNEAIEERREAGNRSSRSRNRIAEARAFAKTELGSSIEPKSQESTQKKKTDKRKKLRGKQVNNPKKKVSSFQFLTTRPTLIPNRPDSDSKLRYLNNF